jgi:hypothetical protein
MEQIFKDRLSKLANFLDTVPGDRFHISTWRDSDSKTVDIAQCDTAACAIGWSTCIIPEEIMRGYICVGGYIDFAGISEWYYDAPGGSVCFDFLFSGAWVDVDNTAKGAAARIRYFLDKGVPSIFKEGIFDTDPVDYTGILLEAVEIYKPYIKQKR